jgi:hypothetical protein
MAKETGDKKSLTEDEVTSEPTQLGRRTAIAAVSTLALGVGATQAAGCIIRTAGPTVYTASGVTDGDNGVCTDPGGNGRGSGGVYNGYTDGDNGAYTDRSGYGRGGCR